VSEFLRNWMSLTADDYGSGPDRIQYERGAMNYIGSKFNCLDQILPLLPVCSKWVDVFGGSGVVTLNRPRSKLEVYNDRHSGLVAFYKIIAQPDGPIKLRERISLMPHSRELFIDYLANWQGGEDDLERAARWYYLVQASVLGRCEAFGRDLKASNSVHRKIHEQLSLFPMMHERFSGVIIENLDWRQCLRDFDSVDTVFYLDPPYWESDIYECKMSKMDHVEMCAAIFQCKGFVALSGYPNPVYDEFPWTGVHQIVVDNRIENGTGKTSANDRVEYLWLKEADY
jgi:DNA adenine methylase